MKEQILSRRLARVYAALFGAVFFLLSLGVLIFTCQLLLREKMDYLKGTMPIVRDHVLEELNESESLTSPDLFSEQAYDLNLNIVLYSPGGAAINGMRNFHMEEAELPRGTGKVEVALTRQDGVLLCLRSDLTEGGKNLCSILLVSSPVNEIAYIKLLALLLLGANILGVVAAGFVGHYSSRKMLSPIDDMIAEAGKIDSRHLTMRLPEPEPDDELRRLALTLNRMLDLVEAAFERQSRFTADASHELRTPLATICGYAELLQRWGKEDAAVLQEGIEAISRQAEYMRKLVDNMLFLARWEGERADSERSVFPVRKLLEELAAEQTALDTKHRYLVEDGPEVPLCADWAMVRQLLLLLLDNSKKFTPEDGVITLSAAQTQEGAHLTVADTGIGMEPEHLAHIFERFYRVDKARSRKEGGAGLGLSIAAAIVQVHGGRIWAQSVPGKGTRIEVVFPSAGAQPGQ